MDAQRSIGHGRPFDGVCMMRTATILRLTLAAAALSLVSACATPFQANVSRFQQLPPAQGQTFAIEARDPALAGGIEFGQYAAVLAEELGRQGYRPAASGESVDLVVRMAYSVDNGRERIRREPGFYDPFWGPRFGGWYRHGLYARPVIVRTRHGYRYVRGFYDPFLSDPFGDYDQVSSYTVYTSGLDVVIDRAGDGTRLFEGSAEAVSRDNDLTKLVPNLIEALFTGFPGNNGERVRVTIAPERERR